MASRLVEAARELAIGIVLELGGDDRALPREEQELVILAQRADFIRREQRASDMLRSERYAGFVAVDRAAHGLEHDRLLAEQIGDELGAVVIVDPEYLQDAGIGQEGAGAALVERAELVNVLQDRPELDAVTGHQPHSALDRFETRSEEHTSELQSLMRISYAVFCL